MNFLNIYIDDILPKIGALVKEKRLTDCLECLESLGYKGDTSIALLAYLQMEVGA